MAYITWHNIKVKEMLCYIMLLPAYATSRTMLLICTWLWKEGKGVAWNSRAQNKLDSCLKVRTVTWWKGYNMHRWTNYTTVFGWKKLVKECWLNRDRFTNELLPTRPSKSQFNGNYWGLQVLKCVFSDTLSVKGENVRQLWLPLLLTIQFPDGFVLGRHHLYPVAVRSMLLLQRIASKHEHITAC